MGDGGHDRRERVEPVAGREDPEGAPLDRGGDGHPTDRTLRAYAAGRLTPPGDEVVVRHILVCDRCLAFLDSLPGAFVAALAAIRRRAGRGCR